MPRFFLETPPGDTVCLTGEDARHIGYALRMRVGVAITLCADGMDYQGTIAALSADTVTVAVTDKMPCKAEPTVSLTLYQALPKLDKLEQIIQKAVELGASRIVPVLTNRCVSRLSPQDFAKKQPRLQKIAHAAAKQAGRGRIPEVASLLSCREAIAALAAEETGLVLYEAGGTPIRDLQLPQTGRIGVFVGSEGGFDPAEIDMAKAAGITPVWLGERILRCETAPLAAISVLMYATGNL